MTDDLGTRMKNQYEHRTRFYLPRRTYTIIRIDGRAFHTYTQNLQKPFDAEFMSDMNATARYLCEQIQGAQFAFVQSDEISILLTDFETINTQAWFDANLQKMVSISASLATGMFNHLRYNRDPLVLIGDLSTTPLASFDSRVFQIPDPTEVENYFIWRQKDTTRNSIQMVVQEEFSHSLLQNKSQTDLIDLLYTQKNIRWSELPGKYKRGRMVIKSITSNQWEINEYIPVFTEEPEFLFTLVPKY